MVSIGHLSLKFSCLYEQAIIARDKSINQMTLGYQLINLLILHRLILEYFLIIVVYHPTPFSFCSCKVYPWIVSLN